MTDNTDSPARNAKKVADELAKQLRQATDGFIHHEAADALEAQAIRIAELEAELSACQRGNDSYHDQSILEHNRAVDMKMRIEELEAALKGEKHNG